LQNDRTGPVNGGNQTNFSYSNPQWIFQDLCFSPEFRLRVADRAHKHLFKGGAMTPAAAQARLDALAAKINLAVKGHSMRGGDTARTPAFNAADWQAAVTGARNYLSNRQTTVVNQLKAYNLTTAYADGSAPLYPLTNAPVFSQHGGAVAAGFQLGISAPNGTIYYTTSGADPRAVGGAIAGAAYTGAIPIIQSVVTVKARVLNGAEWSAMTEATFFADVVAPSTLNIVFSEIHYHPAVASLSEQAAGFTMGVSVTAVKT
jgi:Fn3 associated